MNKNLIYLSIWLCISGIVFQSMAVGISDHHFFQTSSNEVDTIQLSFDFSSPILMKNEEEIILHVEGVTKTIGLAGYPLIPVIRRTIELPFGSQIDTLESYCSYSDRIHLNAPLMPIAPLQQPGYDSIVSLKYMSDVYLLDSWYPQDIKSYSLSSGLNKDNKQVTFLHLQIAAAQYNPVKQILKTVQHANLIIKYTSPISLVQFPDEYDMVVISSDEFAPLLSSLVNHKESVGIQTKLVTLSEIYDEIYFPKDGRDGAEQVKYFIKNAREQWGCLYVLLVGNYQKIPIRYSCLETDAGGIYEELQFVSDLYFMDLYDANGNYSSWDTDNDGRFAEWPYPEVAPMGDKIDMSPDVYVGRLACINNAEVKTMVDKIVAYETEAFGSDWFHRFVVVGGDTFDKSWEQGTDYNEGEVATQQAIEDMTGFNPVKLWASLDTLYTKTIIDEISKGAGFTYFMGHGNPRHWGTHYNGDYSNWTEGLDNRDMNLFTNKEMYPILMVGGCHNSEIDVTPFNIIHGILSEGIFGYFASDPENFGTYWTKNWVLECWGWYIVKVPDGGAIASMGSTGYGGVNIGDYDKNNIADCIESADGWFENQFFRLYNHNGIDILGETYGQTVADYIENFPVNSNRYDAKIVQTHILLGDPSLKIGGYE